MAHRPPLDHGTVLITGASSGIGREVARLVADRARAVALVARREERLNALRDELVSRRPELAVTVLACDLARRDATEAMLGQLEREVGHVDVLINNAGFGDLDLFHLSSWSKLETMIQVNVTALTHLTHRLVAPMIRAGRGGILNISSGFGLTFAPGVAAYAGSKSFVTAFSESLRLELWGTGVVVSQACPGPIATEFMEVAGNPLEIPVPRAAVLSPERCARAIVRGFSRGRAIIIPGFLMKLVLGLARITPRPIMRLAYRLIAGPLRARRRG